MGIPSPIYMNVWAFIFQILNLALVLAVPLGFIFALRRLREIAASLQHMSSTIERIETRLSGQFGPQSKHE